MASLSKRHQARSERALQELIKNVPGNDRCADCQARNPGWASWSLGIFLCMRCAALHRKLGTHVSKVKSLSMDSWSSDQVETMRRVGNANSNRMYNPSNARPAVPLDVDEVDSAMERFIRQKYEQKTFVAGAPVRLPAQRVHTGGSASSEDKPPPPPPKPGRKFGFGLRSSSALPLSGSRDAPVNSPKKKQDQPNKQSRIFGASIGVREDGMEWKLVTLKEMGFSDDRRNTNVLKDLGGDLERAIESLIRLGEGPNAGIAQPRESSRHASGASTPGAQKAPAPSTAGASIQPQQAPGEIVPRAVQSATQAKFPTARSFDPFDVDSPSSAPPHQTGLENQLQQLSFNPSQPSPLFPNATGGHANVQDPMQQARLQQSMTPPPIPRMHQQYAFNNPYAQQASYNPFLQTSPQPSPAFSNNPYLQQQQPSGSLNPFLNQPNLNAMMSSNAQQHLQPSPGLPQQHSWPLQGQPSPSSQTYTPPSLSPALQAASFAQQQQQPLAPLPVFAPQAPFAPQPAFSSQPGSPAQFPPQSQSPYSYTPPPQQQVQQQQLQQPLVPQRTGRIDKSSILALYNYPHLAPAPASPAGSAATGTSSPVGTPTAPAAGPLMHAPPPAPSAPPPPRRLRARSAQRHDAGDAEQEPLPGGRRRCRCRCALRRRSSRGAGRGRGEWAA